MPDYVNEWFSAAINKKVFVLHSPLDRLNIIPKTSILRVDGDKAKCFTFDAALHLINEASLRDLKQRVCQKYPES